MDFLMKKFTLGIPVGLMLVMGVVATIGVSNAFAQSTNDKSGTISSTQNGANGKPEWKVDGTWTFTGVASKSPKFDATFGMQMLNGSAKHKHTINDFKLIGTPSKSSDGTVYNGTATVSLKKGPVNNVPVTIKITNSGDFSLKVDPKLTENHFGDTPIMGKVTT
jgi:hypothetical protein